MRAAKWLLVIAVLNALLIVAVVALAYFSFVTHDALCSFRGDLARRVETNQAILNSTKGPVIHVYGLSIERSELASSVRNQEATLKSLDSLNCEATG